MTGKFVKEQPMTSYIPKQIKPSKERLEIKLEQPVVQRLERYCRYLDSDRDYIVSQALEIAFKKDKGFAEWSAAQDPGRATPSISNVAPESGRGKRS
jgi:hypothetical protein